MLRIAALNEEFSEESSESDEPLVPTKEIDVSQWFLFKMFRYFKNI